MDTFGVTATCICNTFWDHITINGRTTFCLTGKLFRVYPDNGGGLRQMSDSLSVLTMSYKFMLTD